MLSLSRPLPKVELLASWFYPLANYSSLIFNSVNINSTLIIGPVLGILALISPQISSLIQSVYVAAVPWWMLAYKRRRGVIRFIADPDFVEFILPTVNYISSGWGKRLWRSHKLISSLHIRIVWITHIIRIV